MEKTCWFCKRNIEKLKTEFPKDFWLQNSDFFVNIEIKGRLKNATAPYSASYAENHNYEFVKSQKSVCLICIQIIDIENEKAIHRVECYEGTSYLSSDRVGIYNRESFYQLAEDYIFKNHFKTRQRMITEIEDDFGSIYACVIISKLLDRRNHRKAHLRLTDDFLRTEILIARLAKELEKDKDLKLIGYDLRGKKLVKHLALIFNKLKENKEESFEFNEETGILRITRISAFFKMLRKQRHDFEVKLNTIRKSLQYSKDDMEALYSDILEDTYR